MHQLSLLVVSLGFQQIQILMSGTGDQKCNFIQEHMSIAIVTCCVTIKLRLVLSQEMCQHD